MREWRRKSLRHGWGFWSWNTNKMRQGNPAGVLGLLYAYCNFDPICDQAILLITGSSTSSPTSPPVTESPTNAPTELPITPPNVFCGFSKVVSQPVGSKTCYIVRADMSGMMGTRFLGNQWNLVPKISEVDDSLNCGVEWQFHLRVTETDGEFFMEMPRDSGSFYFYDLDGYFRVQYDEPSAFWLVFGPSNTYVRIKTHGSDTYIDVPDAESTNGEYLLTSGDHSNQRFILYCES